MTSKMSKDQREYAAQRAEEIVAEARGKLIAKLPALPKKPNPLSFESKFGQIRDGRATLKPLAQVHTHCHLDQAYTYADSSEQLAYDAKLKKRQAEIEKIHKLYAADLRKTLDKIMLADAQGALAALEALEAALNKKQKES